MNNFEKLAFRLTEFLEDYDTYSFRDAFDTFEDGYIVTLDALLDHPLDLADELKEMLGNLEKDLMREYDDYTYRQTLIADELLERVLELC